MNVLREFMGYPVYLIRDYERKTFESIVCAEHFHPFVGMAAPRGKGDGVIFIFEEYYELPKGDRHFIFYHEAGHIESYPDHSEEAANAWAIAHYPGDGEAVMNRLYEATEAIRESTRARLRPLGIIPKEVEMCAV